MWIFSACVDELLRARGSCRVDAASRRLRLGLISAQHFSRKREREDDERIGSLVEVCELTSNNNNESSVVAVV